MGLGLEREREREREEFWYVRFRLERERERESETDLRTNRSRRRCQRRRKEMERLHLGRRLFLTCRVRSIFFVGESDLNSLILKLMIYPLRCGEVRPGVSSLPQNLEAVGEENVGRGKITKPGFFLLARKEDSSLRMVTKCALNVRLISLQPLIHIVPYTSPYPCN